MASNIDLIISHRGTSYNLSLPADTTFSVLQSRLEELTHVPPANQKLVYKGKKASVQDDQPIVDMGLKNGTKIQMLGATAEELGQLQQAEGEHQRKEKMLRERAMKPQAKLRSTPTASTLSSPSASQYCFHRIVPLPHLPNPASAQKLLNRLAEDPAIRHVMQKNKLAVGLLTELAPHEHPHLLGLNENAGQAIKLRLRTNDYEGLRTYREVRRVLCHELTHNVWGDHDNNFKEMNSRLNREVAEFERAVERGTHRLTDSGDVFEPPANELEAEAQSYVLGGSTSASPVSATGESQEDRRRRILEATIRRLQKEEEEVEMSCGTAGPAAGADSHASSHT